MAMRNLTEPFVLMRNNTLQSKHIYAEQNLSDRMALVAPEYGSSDNVELRNINLENNAPPVWIDALEETQYILSRLRVKVDTLIELHGKQLTRPTLDDTSQEERQMEQLTREIGRAFSNGYRQVQSIKTAVRHATKPVERQLATSAVMALSTALQELGLRYRSAQNHYLTQIKSREERSNQFFPEDQSIYLNNTTTDTWLVDTNETNAESWHINEQRQDSVLLQLDDSEDRMKFAMEREEQIGSIVQSIADLRHIFKDLGNMVQDQGTVLDRIDYNIEQTQVQVQEGYKQLKKADSYQRANRKLYCIVVLAGTIILVSFLFVVFKT
ncbi:PREDICTED: syntaxin-16 [Dufourea novaeangliae]|uniref:Syntaxin-16 n=1 Tax=Dufourea novaeangliae TaxID=178035 RepID=A0A154PCS7_DUFNO|nr:PREDICTED: syntaxin-16 [Dufourea novaeangliae]KZC09068.1 Syntaxin-16 [Dufourea novaeangliae]